jgi:hypothetical protein
MPVKKSKNTKTKSSKTPKPAKTPAKSEPKTAHNGKSKSDEKKESVISKWLSGVKKDLSVARRESEIEREWCKKADKFRVYAYCDLLFKGVDGIKNGDTLTVYGDVDIKEWSVVLNALSNEAYYCTAVNKGKITVNYDGKRVTRPATILTLDDKVKQVKVIRALDKYYEYKGKEE